MLGRGSIVLITATCCCTVVGSHHITQVCKNGHYQCSDVNFWRLASPLKAVLNMTLYRYTRTGSSLKQNLELGQTCPKCHTSASRLHCQSIGQAKQSCGFGFITNTQTCMT